jgi:transmembrane sensor
MMKDIFSISTLIIKKKLKTLSESERFRLKQFKKKHPIAKEVDFDYIVQNITNYETIDNDKAWKNVLKKYKKRNSKSVFSLVARPFLKYAAILVCLLGLGYFFVTHYQRKQDIPKDAITLQLENGNTKIITPNGDETIVNPNGEIVGVQKKDRLVYGNDVKSNTETYNTLNIPFGKRFQVVLSDGTKIHLNAGSSLKFPVKFIKGNQRMVFLTGEAYFDVTKDKLHPFIVHTNSIDVKVLGTKFNVTSYAEDKAINTVLVEGSVQVYNNDIPKQKAMISPGEKASWDKTKKNISIRTVDVSMYTAWMDGQLVFSGIPFGDMIRKLERAYNVSITSKNKELNDEVFSANFNVDIDGIDKVLYYFSRSHPFTFTKTGNQIVINSNPLKENNMK